LNLGVSGLIKDSESLDYMRQSCHIGDIIDVIVTETFDQARSQVLGERQIIQIAFNFHKQSPSNPSFSFLGCLQAENFSQGSLSYYH
jgi:hypothetical protein